MPPVSRMELPFGAYQLHLRGAVDYLEAVFPVVQKRPEALKVFVNGSIVLMVAYLEEFLRSLVGTSAELREATLRKHLSTLGNDAEKARALNCDRPTLVRMAKRRLSFKKDGAAISNMFDALFGCSPWPSESAKEAILDLAHVRHLIIHEGDAEVGLGEPGATARQLRRKDVFATTSYGDWTIYRINPVNALLLYRDALTGLLAQHDHLRRRLVEDDSWVSRS